MRHHRDHRALSRTAEHRKALMRSLVTSLFEHERIETTVAKAKEARRVAERMITYAKRNNLHSRRLVARIVQNETVAKKLFDTITPWYATRQGGYTRILKTRRRLGDAGEMAILELVKSPEQKEVDRKARAERAAAAAAAKSKDKEKAKAKEKPAEKAPEKKAGTHPSEKKGGSFFGRMRRKKEEPEAAEKPEKDKSKDAPSESEPNA